MATKFMIANNQKVEKDRKITHQQAGVRRRDMNFKASIQETFASSAALTEEIGYSF